MRWIWRAIARDATGAPRADWIIPSGHGHGLGHGHRTRGDWRLTSGATATYTRSRREGRANRGAAMRRCEARRRAIGAALLLLAAAATGVSANTRSQQLYAKALIPFHAHRWEEAQSAARRSGDGRSERRGGRLLSRPDQRPPRLPRPRDQGDRARPGAAARSAAGGARSRHPLLRDRPVRRWRRSGCSAPTSSRRTASRPRSSSASPSCGWATPKGAQPLLAEAAKDPALRQSAQYYQAVAALRAGDAEGGAHAADPGGAGSGRRRDDADRQAVSRRAAVRGGGAASREAVERLRRRRASATTATSR